MISLLFLFLSLQFYLWYESCCCVVLFLEDPLFTLPNNKHISSIIILLHYKVFNILCIAISILFLIPLDHLFIFQIMVINWSLISFLFFFLPFILFYFVCSQNFQKKNEHSLCTSRSEVSCNWTGPDSPIQNTWASMQQKAAQPKIAKKAHHKSLKSLIFTIII